MLITDEEYVKYIEKLNKNLTTSELAKIYGMSSIRFNMILLDTNVIWIGYNKLDKKDKDML